ncbi:hypothetical protein MNO14_15430 [Luteimonas sp. S4-F44]|uniref:hypothetical protein n=1 Tax=Luteimonas sp. S4-F44 TaxID=2925842 RepID=UPI001F532C13|nr:hypothetical protein [Luteimonas sp. S4-F44]UNK42306.1 hypothetical protein MNO14_15430 [Luteimonas sp. S4-F44]
MTIQRNDSSARPPDQSARNRQVDRQAKADPREVATREQVDKFRSLMQQAKGGGTGVEQASRQEAAKTGQSLADVLDARTFRQQHESGLSSQPMPAESAAMLQAQMALRDGAAAPQPSAAPAPADPGQLLDMMERHVRQLAVHDARQSGGDGQVLLRMSDATLPGTDLLLTREGEGWVLRADSRSRESFDAIREAGPQLARRFAERNLGTLTIDPHFHG